MIHALPAPGVEPVELWDALVDGRTLFERRADDDFYEAVVRAAGACARGWEHIAMVGGGLAPDRARAACDRARVRVTLLEPDAFFAARGARASAGPGAVVVDVGQTSIKAAGASGLVRRERPADPRALADVVSGAIDAVSSAAVIDRLVLALPCEIAPTPGGLVLGESSYPIAGPASSFVDTLVGWQRSSFRAVEITHDAVLAALVVAARLPTRAPTLVLTVGHGVGAAILR